MIVTVVTGFHKKVGYNTYDDSRPKGGKYQSLIMNENLRVTRLEKS